MYLQNTTKLRAPFQRYNVTFFAVFVQQIEEKNVWFGDKYLLIRVKHEMDYNIINRAGFFVSESIFGGKIANQIIKKCVKYVLKRVTNFDLNYVLHLIVYFVKLQ